MRTLFAIIILSTCCNVYAQREDGAFNPDIKIRGSRWKSNIHCFVNENAENYTLTPVSDLEWNWGNFISFSDSTFSTNYSAPCGLDCFTNVYGTYRLVGHNRVEIYVETISRNGVCNEETGEFEINKSFGFYRFESRNDGLVEMTKVRQK